MSRREARLGLIAIILFGVAAGYWLRVATERPIIQVKVVTAPCGPKFAL